MPRISVSKDTKTVTPLPGPPRVLETPFADPPAEAPPPAVAAKIPLPDPEAPEPPPPPVTKIVREIKTVLVEVPLCDKPPGLDGMPSFSKAHVNLQLIKSAARPAATSCIASGGA